LVGSGVQLLFEEDGKVTFRHIAQVDVTHRGCIAPR
jgi:hypothetical protein